MQIGNRVLVLDDNFEGIIKSIENDVVVIETTDGFELSYQKKELIVKEESVRISFNKNVQEILKEKEGVQKKQTLLKKDPRNDMMYFEVDLHLEKIYNGKTSRLSNFDILSLQLKEASKALEYAQRKRYQRVIFIHGVGDGVLRNELKHLTQRYENAVVSDADYKKYGYGAMEIYLKQNY